MNHGDSPDCGSSYIVDESTCSCQCKACGCTLDAYLPGFPQAAIVVRPTAWLRSMRLAGCKRFPINGRVVGGSGPFVMVQWSDGDVCTALPHQIKTTGKEARYY